MFTSVYCRMSRGSHTRGLREHTFPALVVSSSSAATVRPFEWRSPVYSSMAFGSACHSSRRPRMAASRIAKTLTPGTQWWVCRNPHYQPMTPLARVNAVRPKPTAGLSQCGRWRDRAKALT